MERPADDPRFLAGISYFNRRAFFEAHEIWEEVWREERGSARRFFQGLIQLAVCLHHFGNGNTRGARKLCLSGCGYLQPYRPDYLGVDLDGLLSAMEECCRDLLSSNETVPQAKLDPNLIPTIIVPPILAGNGAGQSVCQRAVGGENPRESTPEDLDSSPP